MRGFHKENHQPSIAFRPFTPFDTRACYDMRRQAFQSVFSGELSPEDLMAGADAYDLDEFGSLIGGMVTFVATYDTQPIGFCTVRSLDATTDEILYLYVKRDYNKRGIGSGLVRHVEDWIRENHPDVSKLVLDTAVPGYNLAFWEKMGYSVVGEGTCIYPVGRVPAVRLVKNRDAVNR